MRIKYFLMCSDILHQDEFMFDTLLNLLDHSYTLLILIIFWHPKRDSHSTVMHLTLLTLQHHTLGQSNSSYSLCHGCLPWCKAPNNFNSKLFSFRREERAKRENNLLDLTYCVFIITPCAIFFLIFFIIFLWLHYLKYFVQYTICGDVLCNFLLLIFNLIPLLSETILCIISILWNLLDRKSVV